MQHSSARVTEQDGSGEGRSISAPHKNNDIAPFQERAVTITNSLSDLARAYLLTPAMYAETQHAELD